MTPDEMPDFGDYVTIEQKRYGADNEMYIHKVVGPLRSNAYVTVPVDYGQGKDGLKEVQHDEVVDVVRCICCGVSETEVRKYRLSDVKIVKINDRVSTLTAERQELMAALEDVMSKAYAAMSAMDGEHLGGPVPEAVAYHGAADAARALLAKHKKD